MHDVLIGLLGIVAVLFFAAAGVYALTEMGVEAGRKTSQIEIDFRAACTAVKGNAVYNGRSWECLK